MRMQVASMQVIMQVASMQVIMQVASMQVIMQVASMQVIMQVYARLSRNDWTDFSINSLHTYIHTHMHVCIRMYVCIQACMYARGRVEWQIQHEAKLSAGFARDPTLSTV